MGVRWATARTQGGKHAVVVPLDLGSGGTIITMSLRPASRLPWDKRRWTWAGWTDDQGQGLVKARPFVVTPGRRLYRFDGPRCKGGRLVLDAIIAGGRGMQLGFIELAK